VPRGRACFIAKAPHVNAATTFEGALHTQPTAVQHVRIHHRRADVGMAEEFLDRADVRPAFEQGVANEFRKVWHPTRFARPAFRPASVTARCTADSWM
jgi:hypothetical protein